MSLPRRRPISALAPLARLLSLLLLVSGLAAASQPSALVLSLLGILALRAEGLRLGAFVRELPPLLLLLGLLFALECLRFEPWPRLAAAELPGALADASRLFAAFVAARLFYQATSSSELREAAEGLGRFLPGTLGQDLALALSLVLGFIPAILLEWRLSLEAARARGLSRRSPGRASLLFVEAFIRRVLSWSLELPEALLARGWTGRRQASRVWGLPSYAALGLSLGFCVAALLHLV